MGVVSPRVKTKGFKKFSMTMTIDMQAMKARAVPVVNVSQLHTMSGATMIYNDQRALTAMLAITLNWTGRIDAGAPKFRKDGPTSARWDKRPISSRRRLLKEKRPGGRRLHRDAYDSCICQYRPRGPGAQFAVPQVSRLFDGITLRNLQLRRRSLWQCIA
jgi:hypothetical protein